MNDELLRPRALFQAIADSVRERIFTHELPPGSLLDEVALATGYGVSRTPVREALKVLAHEGLVAMEPRRGCCVAEFSATDVAALFDALDLLEAYAVREAASRGLAAGAGLANHASLLEAAGNRYAAEAITRLREKLQLALGPAYCRGEAEFFARAAPALSAALARHDAAQAERTWRDYAVARRGLAGRPVTVAAGS
ncbi:GntR family transcriptional regulator [Thauera sinica]|uniref:GntR family transcriptional regulator n=1 Tax=Thauera sinica TaxID=2665146 RepID=A0ABW1ARA7_9RHOO|nr:GntR family transcriptional regulator [Thauera sp. K11]